MILADPPYVNTTRGYRCPLYSCGLRFDEKFDAFEHLNGCLNNSSGVYICPLDGRLENFRLRPISRERQDHGGVASPTQSAQTEALKGIGTHLQNIAHPPTLDFDNVLEAGKPIPRILISGANWEPTSGQEDIQSFRRPISLSVPGDVEREMREERIGKRSIKSDSYHDRVIRSRDFGQSYEDVRSQSHKIQRLGPIEDVNKCFEHIGLIWKHAVQRDNALLALLSEALGHEGLQRGLRSIQSLFGNNPPTAFEDVFAGCQLAFAFALALEKSDTKTWSFSVENMSTWGALFESMCACGQLIDDHSKRLLFRRIVYNIWEASLAGSQDNSQAFSVTSFGVPCHFEVPEDCDRTTLMSYIKSGPLIHKCIGFLNLFDHQVIMDRELSATLHPYWRPWRIERNAQLFTSSVLEPLKQIQLLDRILFNVGRRLSLGQLWHPRDVEVEIIHESMCLDSLCNAQPCDDRVVQKFDEWAGDPNWRDRYYAMSLVQLLILAHDLNGERRRSCTGYAPYRDLLVHSEIFHMSDPSMSRFSQDESFGPDLLTPITSPIVRSRSSSVASDTLTDNWRRCPKCFKAFISRKRADRKKNLRRHMDEMHSERDDNEEGESGDDSDKRFCCFVEGCGASYKQDRNLDKHGAKHHSEITDWLGAKRRAR